MADDTENNVFPFPRIGYNPPPETPPATTHTGPPAPPDQPEAEPSAAPARRSPMESLAAVADPGATLPTQPFTPPAEDRSPVPGFVPDTFRAHPEGESSEVESAGLGALSLAAMLAVAVAALRGIHTAVTNRRATREQRQAVTDAARGGRGGRTSNTNANGAGGGRRVQSGHDFARRTLGRTNPPGGGAGGGRRGGGGGFSPTRSTTNNRSDGPNRRKDTGPNKPKGPNRKPDSPSSSSDRSRADRKEQRDRARREKASGIHRPSQGSDSTTRSRLRRRGKGGTDTADGSSSSTGKGPAGGKGRGGRTKAPTDTAGPKGTLRAPKTKPDRRGRLSLDKDSKGSARTRRRNGGGSGPGKTGPGKPKRGPSGKSAKTGSGSGGTGGRTTLGEAIAAESARRLKRRRKHLKPVVAVVKNKDRKGKKGAGKAGPSGKGTGPSSTKSASTSRPSTPKAGKMKWKRGRNKSGSPWAGTRRRIRIRWQRRQAAWTGGGFAGSGGRRRTPFEAAGMAAGAAYGATYTVERVDNPGDQERRWEPRPPRARAAAGAIAPPRPGGAAPTASGPGPSAAAPSNSTKGAGMSLPANSTPGFNLAPSMSSEHTTEVTLDSTLDTLAGLTKDSFATHDEAAKLARKAKELRYALEELAADLQSRHNVIGRITGAAMALLAEAMEILSAKADAMAVNSLTAAELSESAEQAMFDAYKPVQQATADAGLAVPSARIHNEG